jgi:L-threonylcarbamoyladenylate synthase
MTWFRPKDIHHIADALRSGAVCLFPFDTIWGLTCILAQEPIKRIQELKQREGAKPMLIMVPTTQSLEPFVAPLEPFQREKMAEVWPGPTTLILPKSELVPDYVTGGKPTVGVRVPMFWPVNCLLHDLGQPIVSTSATMAYSEGSKRLSDVPHDIRSSVDFVYEGVEPGGNQASEIWDCTVNPPVRVR